MTTLLDPFRAGPFVSNADLIQLATKRTAARPMPLAAGEVAEPSWRPYRTGAPLEWSPRNKLGIAALAGIAWAAAWALFWVVVIALDYVRYGGAS